MNFRTTRLSVVMPPLIFIWTVTPADVVFECERYQTPRAFSATETVLVLFKVDVYRAEPRADLPTKMVTTPAHDREHSIGTSAVCLLPASACTCTTDDVIFATLGALITSVFVEGVSPSSPTSTVVTNDPVLACSRYHAPFASRAMTTMLCLPTSVS